MKPTITVSLLLNLALAGGLVFSISHHPAPPAALSALPATTAPRATTTTAAGVSSKLTASLWHQLESTNDYRQYVANLRAAGCPEATIADIVNGDARRAFAFKRKQLGLAGNGNGPWSNHQEQQLVAALLEQADSGITPPTREMPANNEALSASSAEPTRSVSSNLPGTALARQALPAQKTAAPVYPLAFREVNPAALGFGATQQAAIAQVRQQFIQELSNTSQNPHDPAYLAQWQSAQINADNTLRGLLGNQAYMAYQQQQYYSWFQPQITAAASTGRSLEINPADFFHAP